jgi:hypothetical protein
MTKIKCLITAGCSYSQFPCGVATWPAPLNDHIKPETVLYLGHAAAGNGIISRNVIYNVTEALKKYKPEEILVGIMWSGADRTETFSLESIETTHLGFHGGDENNYCNPMSIIGNHNKNYYMTATCWDDTRSKNAKEFMINEVRAMVTLEHVLRTQWFLKLHGISYFMTEYDYDCFTIHYSENLDFISQSPDLKFLWDQVEWEHWLPIKNCLEWVVLHSGFEHDDPNDPHPTTLQHAALVERVIIPFLTDKNIL